MNSPDAVTHRGAVEQGGSKEFSKSQLDCGASNANGGVHFQKSCRLSFSGFQAFKSFTLSKTVLVEDELVLPATAEKHGRKT